MKASIIPISGDRKMNKTVLVRFCITITLKEPTLATAAPIKPPISVCEELDGIPNHHVNKFQQIAAIKPASTTAKSTYSG